jgi:hypothetical protein
MRHVGTKCSDVRILSASGLSERRVTRETLRSWCLDNMLNRLKNKTYRSIQTLTDLNGLTTHTHTAAHQHVAQ